VQKKKKVKRERRQPEKPARVQGSYQGPKALKSVPKRSVPGKKRRPAENSSPNGMLDLVTEKKLRKKKKKKQNKRVQVKNKGGKGAKYGNSRGEARVARQ